MYINSSVCISYQESFLNEKLTNGLAEATDASSLIGPDYKQYVSPAQIRRMSTVLKMGVACGIEALRQAETETADAIIVGTGLGCIQDTLKFVGAMYQSAEGTQSPTAFIQSTHNSIAGQLALLLGNRNYNMTHTQGNQSLAYALLDAQLLLAEGDAESALVGAVDEMTTDERAMITALAEKFGHPLPVLGEGSAFWHVSQRTTDRSIAKVTGIRTSTDMGQNLLKGLETDLLLTNLSSLEKIDPTVVYTDYCGEFFTAPGFGLHLALQFLKNDSAIGNAAVHHRFGGQEMVISLERKND